MISIDETSGGFLNHDRERTKSESPEIELSVHDVLPSEPRDTVKETHTVTLPPALMEMPYYPASSMQPRPTNIEEDDVSETRDSGIQQHPQNTASNAHSTPRLQEPSDKSVWSEAHHISNDRRRTSHNIFDMELDVENIPERQRMHSVKRLKPGFTATDRSPSPHAQSGLSKDPKDGRFLIPQIHKTRQGSVGNPLSELSVPNDNVNADVSSNSIGGTTSYDREERRKIASPNGFDQLPTMPSHCDRSDSERLQNEKGIAIGKLLSEEVPVVATVSSQVPDLPPKNWSHLDVEHPLKQALSQARRPEFSIPPNLRDRDLSESNQCEAQAYGGEGLQKEAEEQKEKDRAREKRAEQRRASKEVKAKQDLEEKERRRVSDQKTEKRKADETRLAEDKKAKEEKARVEQLADAKGKDEEAAGAKAAQEAEAREKRRSDDGNRIRQQRSKEKALAEEAEKTRLRQDGANQLIVEKLQKQKTSTSTSSSSKGAAAKIPRSTKTEEQRAGRAEQEAKQRAEQQCKALEAKGPQNWAEALFQFPGSTLHSSEHIDTDPEEEETVTKKVKAKSSGQDFQKLRELSAHRPSPSESSNSGGHYRKSLTPALPSSTVTKSPSVRGSLKSSSPLASVLSSNLDTPLRSALKHHQTPSALHRSVSFVHAQGENPAHNLGVSPDYLAVKPIKTLVELNNELALPPPVVSKDSQKAPFNVLSTNEASKEKVAKQGMVQQKLNVTKDKKLKGRAVDTPTSSGPAPNKDTVSSSSEGDSGSASSPEAVMETGHAKAGPSSRKKPRAKPRQEQMARFNLRGTPIDPAIESMGSTTSRSPPHPLASRASPTSNPSSHRTSVSRSPAQAMSETISVSSGSSSSSQSESEAESGSDFASDSVEEGEAVEVEMPSSTQSSQPTAIKSDINTNVARIEIKHSRRGEQGDRSSQQANSSIRYEAQNADDEAAGQQLQHESSQPVVPAQIARTVPSSGDGTAPHLKLLNQGLNRDGRLPNGTRPAYFMYPKFTTLRQLQETTIPKEEASALPPLQSFAVSSPGNGEPSASSSNESSNESSSSSISDEDEVEVGLADPSGSPASSKSRPGGFSGMKGVMKRKSAEIRGVHVLIR